MTSVRYSAAPRPLDVNYDETKVGSFELPDPLRCADGTPVTSEALWFERRRPELLELFAREVYGRAPKGAVVESELVSRDDRAAGGLAVRLELDVRVRAPGAAAPPAVIRLLVFLPRAAPQPAPAFLGLNLFGNQSVHPDPAIRLASGWVPNADEVGIHEHVANDASRGMQARRWPVELVVARGYALATFYAGDVDPDYPDDFRNGVHALFRRDEQASHPPDAWASLAAWAFGLSRALDALERLPEIDAKRVSVIGHSRFGKAALWAGAQDTRFATAISNDSGRGGAALSRRRFGETVRDLNRRFPHWFAGNFRAYDERESELPVDQHELLALMAPRPVYVASAAQDPWCDPRGELLACSHASAVYDFLGLPGIALDEAGLRLGVSYGSHIGYHRRPGGHDLTTVDWWHYLAFTDRHRLARGGPSLR